jgi:hypothetical protein
MSKENSSMTKNFEPRKSIQEFKICFCLGKNTSVSSFIDA